MSDFPDLPVVPAAADDLPGTLELGVFSVSLTVRDLQASREFYEKLGFVVREDTSAHNYLILRNGETTLGLFQGMFERNILTFNPGLTNRMERIKEFTDVRVIQDSLRERGLVLQTEAESGTGAASCTIIDPDGNPILIDQFFPTASE